MGHSFPGTLSLAACTQQAGTVGQWAMASCRVAKRRNTRAALALLSRALITPGITNLGSWGRTRAGGKEGRRRLTCHTPWALVSGCSSPTCSVLLKLGPALQCPAHYQNQGPAKAAFLLSLLPFPLFSRLWSQPLQPCHSFLEVKH